MDGVTVEEDRLFIAEIGNFGKRIVVSEDHAGSEAGGDLADGVGEVEQAGAGDGGGMEDGHRREAGALHVNDLVEQAEAMGNAARTGVAAGENGDADLVCVAKHFSMAGEDALEVADDFRIVAEVDGTFELQRDGGQGGNPADLPVAHAGELVLHERWISTALPA